MSIICPIRRTPPIICPILRGTPCPSWCEFPLVRRCGLLTSSTLRTDVLMRTPDREPAGEDSDRSDKEEIS